MTATTDRVRSQHEIDVMFQHLIFGAKTRENLAVQGVTDHSNSNKTLGDFTPEYFDQLKERMDGVPGLLQVYVNNYVLERHQIFESHHAQVDRLAKQCTDGEITRDQFNAGVQEAAETAQRAHDGTAGFFYSQIHHWMMEAPEQYTPEGLWDVLKGVFDVVSDVVEVFVSVVVAVAQAVWTVIKFIVEFPYHVGQVFMSIIKWIGRLF